MTPAITAPKLSEAQWQEQVIDLGHALGWRHLHVRRSIGKGKRWTTATNVPWPDLTLWSAKQQRVLFVELKTDTGRLTNGQRDTLGSLARAGAEVRVWRPRDFDLIRADLEGKRP